MRDQTFSDLRSFIERLRRDGDLVVVDAPVDPNLEVAEVHRRVVAGGGPALLFTNVKGAAFPLVTNLFGSSRRAALAFGTRPLAFIKRLVHLAEILLPLRRPSSGAPATWRATPCGSGRRAGLEAR
jgi:UbiD family decarboxylase